MRGRQTSENILRQANPHCRHDPSSVGLSPDTFSRKGRRESERRLQDFRDHLVWPEVYDPVRKAKDHKALASEPVIALGVEGRSIFVKWSIGLNDQTMPKADKIGDILSDRNLTPKFQSFEPSVAKQIPQSGLRAHGPSPHGLGQRASAIDLDRHPTVRIPSPLAGEGGPVRGRMRGRQTSENILRQANPRCRHDPSSVGLSPDTFSRKGRRKIWL
jgi:hypothetical protein